SSRRKNGTRTPGETGTRMTRDQGTRINAGSTPGLFSINLGSNPLHPRGFIPRHPRSGFSSPRSVLIEMLTGKLVRVRYAKNKLVPLYVEPGDQSLLALTEQLLFAYRSAPGRTR